MSQSHLIYNSLYPEGKTCSLRPPEPFLNYYYYYYCRCYKIVWAKQ